MTKFFKLATFCLLVALFSFPNLQAQSQLSATDEKDIQATYAAWMNAFEKMDASLIPRLLAENAVEVNPLGMITRGKSNLSTAYVQLFEYFKSLPKPNSREMKIENYESRYLAPNLVSVNYVSVTTNHFGAKTEVEKNGRIHRSPKNKRRVACRNHFSHSCNRDGPNGRECPKMSRPKPEETIGSFEKPVLRFGGQVFLLFWNAVRITYRSIGYIFRTFMNSVCYFWAVKKPKSRNAMSIRIASFILLAVPIFGSAQDKKALDSLYRAFHAETRLQKKADLLYDIACENMNAANPDELGRYADSIELLAQKADYRRGLARSLDIRGQLYYQKSDFGQALPFFRQQLSVFSQAKDSAGIGSALTNIGNCFNEMGLHDSSITYLLRAVEIKERLGDLGDVASGLANIGNMYVDGQAYDKGIELLLRALKIRQGLGQEKRTMFTFNNLVVAYGSKKDFKNAFNCAENGLAIATKHNNQLVSTGTICSSMAHLLCEEGRFEEAIEWATRSMDYFVAGNRTPNMVYPLVNLARAHNSLGHFQKGLEFAEKGHKIMLEHGLFHPMTEYYEQLAAANEGLGKPQVALDWYKKYIVFNDSLEAKDNLRKLANLDIQYQTQKKEAVLAQKTLQIERQKSQRNGIIAAAILALATLGSWFQFVHNRQRVRQKEASLAAQFEHAEAEKLRELDQLKSTFFANISHEFRTPLTLILSPLDQILDGSLSGDLKKYHRIMQRNARRLLELVNQLLDLSKLEAGKMSLHATPGDLGQFLRSVSFSFESLAVRKNIRFLVETPENPIETRFRSRQKSKRC